MELYGTEDEETSGREELQELPVQTVHRFLFENKILGETLITPRFSFWHENDSVAQN